MSFPIRSLFSEAVFFNKCTLVNLQGDASCKGSLMGEELNWTDNAARDPLLICLGGGFNSGQLWRTELCSKLNFYFLFFTYESLKGLFFWCLFLSNSGIFIFGEYYLNLPYHNLQNATKIRSSCQEFEDVNDSCQGLLIFPDASQKLALPSVFLIRNVIEVGPWNWKSNGNMDLETHETPNFTLARKNYTQILLFETSHSIINMLLWSS